MDVESTPAGQMWPHLLELIAAGDTRLTLETSDGGRVVLIAESRLQRLEAAAQAVPAPRPTVSLTDRESEVLSLIAAGFSGAEAADRLQVATNTIAQHLAAVRRKYGVKSTAAAVVAAQQDGQLPRAAGPHDLASAALEQFTDS